MTHIAEHKVRSYECDAYNHVNNSVYLNYLEYGRMEFLNAIGFDFKGVTEAGFYLYVTHIDIYYKASAVLNDKLLIEITPTKMKTITGEFKQTVKKEDGTICAEATVTWACVSKEGRPSRLPTEFMVPGLIPDQEANS